MECESITSLLRPHLDLRSESQLLWRETSEFGIMEKSIWRGATTLRSVLQLVDVRITMIILLDKIRPQLLYSFTKSIPKHINFTRDLYDNSHILSTSCMVWNK